MHNPENFNEQFLADLSDEQRTQVELQLKEHEHERYTTDIDLGDTTLKDFIVHAGVLRPERMVARNLAMFLHQHPELSQNKTTLDMGSGTGLQGIVTGLEGAKHITFADISEQAIANTQENVEKFGLREKSLITQSDLFSHISDRTDRIIFNHPFFPGKPSEHIAVSRAMLDDGGLLQRFLKEAKMFLNADGSIIMPYYHIAGETNDPSIQALKHDYDIRVLEKREVAAGAQKGLFSIVELMPKK